MVHLMLGGARIETVQPRLLRPAIEAEMGHDDAPGALDVAADVRKAEAALFHAARLVGLLDDARIDEGEGQRHVGIEARPVFVFHVVAFRQFQHADGFRAADLLGGEAHALRGAHRREHVGDQGPYFGRDGGNGLGGFPQDRIPVGVDGEKGTHGATKIPQESSNSTGKTCGRRGGG